MKEKYLTTVVFQTKKLGENLAKKILKSTPKKTAFVLGLKGNLGGGKTTFLQGFAKGLGIKEKILSPTFVVMKRFEIKDLRFQNFYHIDCYRIKEPKEILDLGFKKIVTDPQNIVAVEWADRIRRIIPQSTTWIQFGFIGKATRQITIKCTGRTRALYML